jgi:hypothetical protein
MKSKREVIRANTQLLSEIAKKSDQKIQVLPPDSVGGNVVDLGFRVSKGAQSCRNGCACSKLRKVEKV